MEIFYLWIPSPTVAAQRVAKGGHHIPLVDIERRYQRSLRNFVNGYAPLADVWKLWNNYEKPAVLTASSLNCSLSELEDS